MPPSGSSTSPLPVRISRTSASATIIIASRLRKYLSVRQSLASSTAARISWPLYCSSLRSSRSNKVKASAVAPAKPPMTLPSSPIRRTLRALGLMTVLPRLTWPSPAMTVRLPFFTPRMVVPCQLSKCPLLRTSDGNSRARLQALLLDPLDLTPGAGRRVAEVAGAEQSVELFRDPTQIGRHPAGDARSHARVGRRDQAHRDRPQDQAVHDIEKARPGPAGPGIWRLRL